jgi:hypothetical protein
MTNKSLYKEMDWKSLVTQVGVNITHHLRFSQPDL